MTTIFPATVESVRGDVSGLLMPAHTEALRTFGPQFLTEALQAFGRLEPGNSVREIRHVAPCPGGSTGEKCFLTVSYEHPRPGLHEDLFVKFSRDFSDPGRDARGKHEMLGEVHLGRYAAARGLPVPIPKVYFADYNAETHTGMLITETIAFGRDGIEPQHQKCMDHLIADPIEYYRTIIGKLALIAAIQADANEAPFVDAGFPYHPQAVVAATGLAVGLGVDELEAKIADLATLVGACRDYWPVDVHPDAAMRALETEAGEFVARQHEFASYLTAPGPLVALCHWNANIDNCWFWRDPDGRLDCGLMDWGHAGQINLAFALWGCLCAAPAMLWIDHLDEIVDHFVQAYAERSGVWIDRDELLLNLCLYVTFMGLGYFLESPARIRSLLPGTGATWEQLGHAVANNASVRNQIHILGNVLAVWQRFGLGSGVIAVPAGGRSA